jgi:DNA-directed RNA polymerase sigma subunit (sigma70/sigma32)
MKAGETITPSTTNPGGTGGTDPVLEALEALDAALAANAALSASMRERIARVVADREAGSSYRDIVAAQRGRLLVAMLTEASTSLDAAGAAVRRAEARALYEEGMTMDQIAALFGVSRQRVSALLREPRRSP